MDRPWWASLLQWTIWWIVMAAVMGWVAKSRMRKRPDSDRYTLRHPSSTLVLGVVTAIFFFGIAIVSNTVGKNSTTTIWTTLLFVGFGFLSVPILADYFFVRHRLSEQGIEYTSMFGRRGSLRWSEIRTVSFSPAMKWFVLWGASGTKARISAMLIGLPEFAQLVLRYVPKTAMDAETQAILGETAQGRPPSIWG